MANRMQYIADYFEGLLNEQDMRSFEDLLCKDDELLDTFLMYKHINEYMQGRMSLDEVRADKQLIEADAMAREAIEAYPGSLSDDTDELKFIRDSILEEAPARSNFNDDIRQIKYEINELNLEEVASGWVKDWRERQEHNGHNDLKVQEIKEYIRSSLNLPEKTGRKKINAVRTIFRPWITIAAGIAASMAIAGYIIMSLLITPLPENLFDQFYQTMPAVSPVTRSSDPGPVIDYASAIGLYRQGDFELAAARFSEIHLNYEGFTSARFFEGTSRIELGQYEMAISLLHEVADAPGEYQRDAQWYMALAYLKTGEKNLAARYLKELAGMDGFYQDGARRILRRLQ